jgi:hypothetical protein
MNALERIVIENECTRLVYAHCHLIDAGDYSAYLELWLEDGVWEMQSGPVSGRAELRKYLDARAPGVGRHHASNVLIDVIDAHSARGRSSIAYYRGSKDAASGAVVCSGPAMIGDYRDEFRLTPQGWCFARRNVVAAMRAASK